MSRRRSIPAWLAGLLVLPVAIASWWIGMRFGNAFGYAVAALEDRDVAELEDMLVWCNLAVAPAASVFGVWLLLVAAGVNLALRRAVGALFIVLALAASGMIAASYAPAKTSGVPVVDYEIRLPAGLTVPGDGRFAVTVWSETRGDGASMTTFRLADGRPEVGGALVLPTETGTPTMSLRLSRTREGYWRLPIASDAKLDKRFGSWQRIEFLPQQRGDTEPLPTGDYEIRYRVRRYI